MLFWAVSWSSFPPPPAFLVATTGPLDVGLCEVAAEFSNRVTMDRTERSAVLLPDPIPLLTRFDEKLAGSARLSIFLSRMLLEPVGTPFSSVWSEFGVFPAIAELHPRYWM